VRLLRVLLIHLFVGNNSVRWPAFTVGLLVVGVAKDFSAATPVAVATAKAVVSPFVH